jgi:hypothetical protein
MMWLPTTTAQYGNCFSFIKQADVDNDRILTEAEFVGLVRLVTSGAIAGDDPAFSALPAAVSNLYVVPFGDTSGGVDISAIDFTLAAAAVMESFCFSLYPVLAEALGVTTTQRQCFVAIIIGDTSRDNNLVRESEFVRFANQMAGGVYGISIPFDDLPDPVNAIYEDFSSASEGVSINVSGTKPGTIPTDAELPFLQNLCFQLSVAIIAGEQEPLVEPTPSGPGPTPAPAVVVVVESPTVSFSVCRNGLIVSDLNRNDFLDEDEYLRFVNRLSNNEWIAETYDTIPAVLQENFVNLLDSTGQIPVIGSKPGQTATAAQQDNLNKLCFDTDDAIDQALNPPPPIPGGLPTSAPVGTTVQVTTSAPTATPLDFTACKLNMIVADINRDDEMNDEEYVRFLNRFTQNMFGGFEYIDLAPVLQDNFVALAGVGELIPLSGSKPGQSPTPEEETYLTRVCVETISAIDSFLRPAPTAAPTPLVIETQTVYNSFVMSNTVGLRASSLLSGRERRGLNDGWASFAQEVFTDGMAANGGDTVASRRRSLRGNTRRLDFLGLTDLSAVVYQIDDMDCPSSVTTDENTFCQEAFASFSFDYVNEADPENFSDSLFGRAVNAINAGDLQDQVVQAFTLTNLLIEATTDTERPPEILTPTSSPRDDRTRPPTRSAPKGDDEGGGGSSIGTIIGGLLGISVVLAGGGYWYYRRRKKGGGGGGGGGGSWCGCLSGLSLPKKQSKKESTLDGDGSQSPGDEDRDGGRDRDEDEEDENPFKKPQKGGLGGMFGGGGDDDDEVDDDEHASGGGFSVQEQSPSKTKNEEEKNTGVFGFGLGGKQKKNSENNLGADFDMDQDGGAADFADYGFDDPDDIKVGLPQAADGFFGSGGSNQNDAGDPNWGDQGQNQAGAAWGGSNAFQQDQKQDTFFGEASDGSGSPHDDEDGMFGDEDSGSETNSYDDDEDNNDDTKSGSRSGSVVPDNMRQLDALVEKGDWDGVMAAAQKFETDLDTDEQSKHSGPSVESDGNDESESRSSGDGELFKTSVFGDKEDAFDDATASSSVMSMTSEEVRRRSQYREQVVALVRKTVPDEIDNVDAMLDQFMGREAELINTLQTMYERSSTQRARKAVHKSKGVPQRDSRGFSPGGAEGSAAIAAASTIGVQHAFDGPKQPQNFQGDGFRGDGEDDEGSGTGSYDDDEESGTGSYDDEEPDEAYDDGFGAEGSYGDDIDDASGSGSGSGSFDDEGPEGPYDDDFDDGEGSYVSGEGSQVSGEGSYVSGEGSYQSGEGSQVSGEGSYVSGEGSYQSGEGSQVSGEGSQVSDEGSYVSGEGSYHSGEGSQVSGEGSYVSGEGSYQSGEGSYHSGEEGSYVSGEEGSYQSGEEGSYVSGEGSVVSGEGSYVSGEGSNQSGEGSYVSGEGSQQSGEGSYQSGSGSYDDEDDFQD